MSKFTDLRRWAARKKRAKFVQMTEHNITPDEARIALHAVLASIGHEAGEFQEYNPNSDRFLVMSRNQDGKVVELWIPGETVANTVVIARTLAGKVTPLKRKTS